METNLETLPKEILRDDIIIPFFKDTPAKQREKALITLLFSFRPSKRSNSNRSPESLYDVFLDKETMKLIPITHPHLEFNSLLSKYREWLKNKVSEEVISVYSPFILIRWIVIDLGKFVKSITSKGYVKERSEIMELIFGLSYYKNLRTLEIRNIKYSDIFYPIKNLKFLQTIILTGRYQDYYESHYILNSFKELEYLRTLSLSDMNVTCISTFEGFKLKTLSFKRCIASEQALNTLGSVEEFKALHMTDPILLDWFGIFSLGFLSKLDKLEVLSLDTIHNPTAGHDEWKVIDIDPLSSLLSLRALTIRRCRFTSLNPIFELPLEYLTLIENKFFRVDEQLQEVSKIKTLEGYLFERNVNEDEGGEGEEDTGTEPEEV
jgi:hypothetical protein